jgi:glycosyltransferase involved in cell wall biosynthesis
MDEALPISVVIPAYNREALLPAALQSIDSQQRRPAEIIVVDDGSSDATADVAQRAGATVVRQSNRGVSAARNAGIRRATQPWIAFLDSDDAWLPAKLEWQWSALAAEPAAGFALGDWLVYDDAGFAQQTMLQKNARYRSIAKRRLTDASVALDQAGLSDALLRENFIALSTVVVRRELLGDEPFPEDMRYTEDLDLLLRLSAASSAVCVESTVLHYRVHGAGASRNRARIQLGRVAIADRVAAHPERYPPGAPEFFARDKPVRLARAARLFLQAGDVRAAAAALGESLRLRWSRAKPP